MCCLLNKANLMPGTPHVSDTSAHRLIKHMKMMFIGDTPKSEFFYFCHGMPLCLVQFCLIYFQFDPCCCGVRTQETYLSVTPGDSIMRR